MQTAIDSIAEAISISQVLAGVLKTAENVFPFPFLTSVIDLTSTYSLLLAKVMCAHPEVMKRVQTADVPLLNRGSRRWTVETLLEDNADSLEAIFDTKAQASEPDGRVCSVIGVINILKEAHVIPDLVDLNIVTHSFQRMCRNTRRIDVHQFLLLLEEVTAHNEATLYKVICQILQHYGYDIIDRCSNAKDVIYTLGPTEGILGIDKTMTKSELIDIQVEQILDNEKIEIGLANKIEKLVEKNFCNSRSGIIQELLDASHHFNHLSSSSRKNRDEKLLREKATHQLQRRPVGTSSSVSGANFVPSIQARQTNTFNDDLIAVYSKLFYKRYKGLLIKQLNPAVVMPGTHIYQLKHKLGFLYDSIKQFYGTEQYVSFNNALKFLLLNMKNSGLGRKYLSDVVRKSLDIKIGGHHVMSELGFAEMLFIAALSVYNSDEGDCDMMTIEEKVLRVITIILENR